MVATVLKTPRVDVNTPAVWAVGYVLVVLGMILLFFQDSRQDAQREQDRDLARGAAVACIKKVVDANLTGSQARSDAAETRDMALRQSKIAMRELVRLRVLEGVPNSAEVRQAAAQYVEQTRRYIEADKALEQARKDYPIPDVVKVCSDD